jgi:hypothetical protein
LFQQRNGSVLLERGLLDKLDDGTLLLNRRNKGNQLLETVPVEPFSEIRNSFGVVVPLLDKPGVRYWYSKYRASRLWAGLLPLITMSD